MTGHQYSCSEGVKDAFHNSGYAVVKRAATPLYHPNFIYRLTSLNQAINHAHGLLKGIFRPIIERREKLLNFENEKRTFNDEVIKLSRDGKIETDELVEENLISIIFAVSLILFTVFLKNKKKL